MKRFKMGVFNNLQLHDNFDIKEYIKSFNEQIQTGFKLDKNNNYDMQQKRLVNLAEAVDADDAITKHQMEVGLASKADPTNVLLLDGRNHMTGDLDMRGNKIILPGEIDMNRKLIINLDTDQNQDLSAVNMATLKTNIGQKVDKKYVDDENAKFVKKTGDVLSGDLVLVHDSFPVQGNTNKAVSYETQREIFLSRKESFPMQADINMNNNFLQNVATPTSSHQGANKGYCDYNFLNRQKGGRIMGSLSMNQNDLFEIPAPKYGSSAANKNYVDAKSVGLPLSGGTLSGDLDMDENKIINLPTPTLAKDAANKSYVDSQIVPGLPLSGGTLSGNLDMDENKIVQLKEPTAELDGANKHYVDCKNNETINIFNDKLLSAHLTSNKITNVFKYLLDPDELSAERDIIVNGLVDFDQSPHTNKKAYDIDLVYISGIRRYNSKIGVNLYPLPIGDYSLVMEYYFPENIDITLVAQATKVHIVKQTRESFPNYKKIIVQFTKTSILLSDYMYFYIHGGGTTSSNPEGYLIFYGVNSLTDDVSPQIYSHPLNTGMFDYEDDKMKMKMDLDLNGHALVGIQNSFFIHGYFDKSQNPIDVVLNHQSTNQIIPMNCILTNILCYFLPFGPTDLTFNFRMEITRSSNPKSQLCHSSSFSRSQDLPCNLAFSKLDLMRAYIFLSVGNAGIPHDKAIFTFVFC